MVTKLLEGHSRFRREYFEHERELFQTLATGAQRPVARNIANIVPPFGRHLSTGATLRAYEPEANEFRPVEHFARES